MIKGENEQQIAESIQKNAAAGFKSQIAIAEAQRGDFEEQVEMAKANKESVLYNGGKKVGNRDTLVASFLQACDELEQAEANLAAFDKVLENLKEGQAIVNG